MRGTTIAMRLLTPGLATIAYLLLGVEAARVVLDRREVVGDAAAFEIARRELPDSPSGGYAPSSVNCPASRPVIRDASSLSPNETAWLQLRRNNTIAPMITLLTAGKISGFDASSYIAKYTNNATALPNIAIAVSGGGYRAMMNGAGFLAAADNRTTNSTGTGQIGGLLQASTYLSALSGGGWLVSSIFANNYSTVETLRDGSSGSSVWQFGNSVFEGPASSGISILNSANYWSNIVSAVDSKSSAGFSTSITDAWGRALSYQLINATDGGPSYTFSSIQEFPGFVSGDTPFPILVADGRAPGTAVASLNSTVFEFGPFEMGSFDPTLYAFAPMRYLGSNFTAGVVPAGQQCIRGFDQSGFVLGTSSSLFNEVLTEYNNTNLPSIVTALLDDILDGIGKSNVDIAQYTPNPFYLYKNETTISKANNLDLVDGGEDGQNIPLTPLIQPARGVDVIFAVDSSADTTYGWPNGTSLVATYQRSLNTSQSNGTVFPSIPDQNTFINLGLNTKPTFFGCDAGNMTGSSPLVVYIPNAPYVASSNVSTYDLSYNNTQRNAIIQNGYDVATLGNGTADSQWPTCLACAILSRSFTKTGTTVPADCTTCFTRYCWNGTVNSTTPAEYAPGFKLGEISLLASGGSVVWSRGMPAWSFFVALGAAVLILL